jgi:acetyl/propionyl-CoA carboxylase alpha subunit
MKRLLVANRGEIAIRIMKTAKAMGIETVAVYSDSDSSSWHKKVADESLYIGGSTPKESYINIENIIEAALKSGADFVHPGYGFLSENAEFIRNLQKVELNRITLDS